MKRKLRTFTGLVAALVLAGCALPEKPIREGLETSPTVRLARGDLPPEDYFESVRAKNIEAQQAAQFEVNRDETRVFNLATGRFEYVPEGTPGKVWNETEQRWEWRGPREK
jgi:hypothetical protein